MSAVVKSVSNCHVITGNAAVATQSQSTAEQLLDPAEQDLSAASIRSESAALARPLAIGSGNITIAGKTSQFTYECRHVASGVVQFFTESDLKDEKEKNILTLAAAVAFMRQRKIMIGNGAQSGTGRTEPPDAIANNDRVEDTVSPNQHIRQEKTLLDRFRNKFATWAAIAGLGLAAMPEKASGALMLNGTPMPGQSYMDHSVQYNGSTVWIKVTTPEGVVGQGSGILLDPYTVLTAAHVILDNGETNTINYVGNGSNFYTNRGDLRYVVSWAVADGYVGSLTDGGPDLAIMILNAPYNCPMRQVGSMALGEVYTDVGYGMYGTPNDGLFAPDGNRRAFDAPVGNFGNPGIASSDYAFLLYDQGDYGSINAQSEPGYSGSGIVDSQGNIAGTVVAGTTGGGSAGYSIAVRDDLFAGWIQTNRAMYLNYQVNGSNLVLTWYSAGVLQSATSLNGSFTDVTNASSPYTTPMNGTQLFYRLRSSGTNQADVVHAPSGTKLKANIQNKTSTTNGISFIPLAPIKPGSGF